MQLILEPNAAISALLWQGVPGDLIEAARTARVELFTGAPLLKELRGVLGRLNFARQLHVRALSIEAIVDGYAAMATIVIPASIGAAVERDLPDEAVLATALAAGADLIVSGDAHLLGLKSFHRLPIVDPDGALRRIRAVGARIRSGSDSGTANAGPAGVRPGHRIAAGAYVSASVAPGSPK